MTAADDIVQALRDLRPKLDAYEQTTHGRMGLYEIQDVANCLWVCHRTPSAFNISNLAQCLDGFLKEK